LIVNYLNVIFIIVNYPIGSDCAVELFADIKVGEDVRLESQGEPLSVTFLGPEGSDGPVPAVVMVVGSGAYSFRSSYKAGRFPLWKRVAEAFLAKGYAVLFLEKKGINASGGDWQKQSFADRAEDVRVAVEYLGLRDGIAPDKIGLCGHSQGGWVVQLAAALYPDIIAFAVMLAGPSVTVKQQILDDMKAHFTRDGRWAWTAPWRTGALSLYLSAYAWVSRFRRLSYLSGIINYDPSEATRAIRCPLLAVYGEHDRLVLPDINSQLLASWIDPSVSCLIAIVPGANHGFALPSSDGDVPAFAPGFLDIIAEWNPF
jgi:uncharacterized protein